MVIKNECEFIFGFIYSELYDTPTYCDNVSDISTMK